MQGIPYKYCQEAHAIGVMLLGGGATAQLRRGSPCTGHDSYALPRCGTPPHGESSAEPATGMRVELLTSVWRTGGTASCWCLYLGVSQREDCEAWHTRIRPCMHMLNLCGQDLMRCHGARATGGAAWDADAVGATASRKLTAASEPLVRCCVYRTTSEGHEQQALDRVR